MRKNSVVDYWGYAALKVVGPLIRLLPLGFSLFLGRVIGSLFYYFDLKHKAVAYANIKKALGGKLSARQLSRLSKEFYENFGQSIIEIFLIPKIDKKYINKYISIEGRPYVDEAFKRGKGIIFTGMHAGSWELSSIISANLGYPFSLFVRGQRYPRLEKLLNAYRQERGCKIIQRENQARALIQVLKNNEAFGMTVDQGGRAGTLVKFFGQDASMPTGAIRLALKYDAVILPVFYTRRNGPYHKLIVEPPLELKRTGDAEKDIRDNLQSLVAIFEKLILRYPKDYLWTYKIWKYAKEKNILILSDQKAGHLRQSEAALNIIAGYLKDKGIDTHITTVAVGFKNKFAPSSLALSSLLSGRYSCQGCLWCLRNSLAADTYRSLISAKPDIIISCGSALAPINFVLSRENAAKSVVILRPGFLSTKRFDLVIMPRHDNPPRRKNIAITEGALNLINDEYLKTEREKLSRLTAGGRDPAAAHIGLLLGGNTKEFLLSQEMVLEVIRQLKQAAEKMNAVLLITTSRRTSKEVEELVKREFREYSRCKLLVIANEKNIPEAVGGILGLSQIIVTSPESISMISEAVNSKKYVLVFAGTGLPGRHQRFIRHFAKNKYIHLVGPGDLGGTIADIWRDKPEMNTLKDNFIIAEAVERLL
ncbi:MAG: ELM1/GtrOC1 family putative glycosyltransferase [Candidatus Omnitrophota bacterium]|jgi:KDO2-lipid IV(A) lauroyltransferase